MSESPKIKTPKQQAKQKSWIGFFVILAIAVALGIAGLVLKEQMELVHYLLWVAAVVVLIADFVYIIKRIKKVNRSFCSRCGEKLDYDHFDTDFRLVKDIATDTKKGAVVDIAIECENCGHVDVNRVKMIFETYDKATDSWQKVDLQSKYDDLFIK